MLFAIHNDIRVQPEPGSKALCPLCSRNVIARCGDINIWHWAHQKNKSCDGWFESETQWHRNWKSNFPVDWIEFIINKNGERHIADIYTNSGVIIELQNSPISNRIIEKREMFYGSKMLWIINGIDFKHNFSIYSRSENYYSEKNSYPERISQNEIPKNLIRSENLLGVKLGGECNPSKLKNVLNYLNFVMDKSTGIYYRSKIKQITNSNFNYFVEALNEYNDSYLPEFSIIPQKNHQINSTVEKTYFNWSFARKSWFDSQRPIFIDFGDSNLFYIQPGCVSRQGQGTFVSKEKFIKKYTLFAA